MTRRRWAMLGVLVVGFSGAGMTGACGSNEPGPLGSGVTPPDMAPECPASMEKPCMRYRIPLVGNPSTDVALRAKYIAAFGTACYMSEANTFDCFYQKWEKACADAVKIGEVSGNAPYDEGYTCQPVGNGDYTLQIGSDVANTLTINYQAAPRQTPLIEINGVPTEVSGPYRNLPEPQELGPGIDFYKKTLDKNGKLVDQHDLILQVNRDAHGGKIHSDLAGFIFPCEKGKPKLCPEPDVLNEPADWRDAKAEVHHVVPMKDKRCCPWGTNSNKNAVVISHKLNDHFTNNDPPVEEVLLVNQIPPYTP
ncbi:hypothetical protein [Polyangium sp. 6x1]|uniref:hypothetical protein n=1 Tax=Polyangium sp. 6x1 TaxID=3042689 RepID=UPI002482BB26|nr:hypothetical protein [Polyangium sp. 6x1]MDI1448659.1 hypothetical protein [Polyangium sp. 6x1]